MENNIINDGQIIINGGNGLKDCPKTYEAAHAWADKANGDNGTFYPLWKFDCGFKLDYDGPLVHVSSRFYPPKTHYGETWDGTVSIMIGEDDLIEKSFDCETLEKLRVEVEAYVLDVKSKLCDFLKQMNKDNKQ